MVVIECAVIQVVKPYKVLYVHTCSLGVLRAVHRAHFTSSKIFLKKRKKRCLDLKNFLVRTEKICS